MRTCSVVLALAVGLAGCEGGAKPTEAKTGSAQVPAAPKSVEIFVDDQAVGTLAIEQIRLWPRLDMLVPMAARRLGTWQAISIKGKAAKVTEVNQPSSTHPDLVAALFPGEGGAPAFGMFDPVELAKKAKPALREDSITEIRIKLAKNSGRGENDHQGGEVADPAQLKLTIKTAAGEQIVAGTKLLETPRQPLPGEGNEPKGWPLSLILDHAGVNKYERLLLTGDRGTNLTLEQQDLDPKTSIPFIKLNRQGALRFRVYKKQGETWQAGPDLRGLVRVEVLK